MRRHLLLHLTIASVLAFASACIEPAAPAYVIVIPPVQPAQPPPPPPPPPPESNLYLTPSNVSILTNDSLSVHGFAYPGEGLESDTLDWSVNDSTLASIDVVGTDRVVIHTLQAGDLLISARTRGSRFPVGTSASVKILARSSQPAPIEVVEFYANEYTPYWNPSEWTYTPQLSLRAVGQDSVRILGVTFDLPGSQWSPYCSIAKSVPQSATPMIAPLGYENSIYLAQEDHRSRPGAQAVARITVLLNDGTGAQFVVSGPIVSPLNVGDAFSHAYDSADGDWLWCG